MIFQTWKNSTLNSPWLSRLFQDLSTAYTVKSDFPRPSAPSNDTHRPLKIYLRGLWMPPQAYRTDFWQLVTTNGLSTNTTVDIIHFFSYRRRLPTRNCPVRRYGDQILSEQLACWEELVMMACCRRYVCSMAILCGVWFLCSSVSICTHYY